MLCLLNMENTDICHDEGKKVPMINNTISFAETNNFNQFPWQLEINQQQNISFCRQTSLI